jgi:hypothetical protein
LHRATKPGKQGKDKMTQAQFSNGFTDTYKGKRAVKAAWMITNRATGEVVASGHSLDRVKAAKTAANNQRAMFDLTDLPQFDVPSRLYAGANYSYLFDRAEQHGYTGRAFMGDYKRWAKQQNARRNAEIEEKTNIEIIDI